mmetsp:Transcript_5228/g.10803  ORF Transcript_5228/g.10803 Transcript_5228/m.10803 type:complete len:353 (-) Transcript_5228:2433-3491(-)
MTLMESEEHSLLLKDGRTLAYHTFRFAEEKQNNPKDVHPVFYFHGFPGCGIEAGFGCARSVAMLGGRVYAIDRPGMGKTSSPYNESKTAAPSGDSGPTSDADENLEAFIDNIWELVEHQGWKEFSVIGVSGGGPYALALLASYLRKKSNNIPVAHLVNVCLVAAITFSAGTEDLIHINQVGEKAQTSGWYRVYLGSMSATMSLVFNYLLPALPLSWTKSLISYSAKTLPPADREVMSDEKILIPFLKMMQSMAAQGGYHGIYHDAMILMRSNQPYEEYVREAYQETNEDLPAIGIFHGLLDVNVPPSHGHYLHESIFSKRSKLFRYEGLGHLSLVMAKHEEYAAFATTGKKQ